MNVKNKLIIYLAAVFLAAVSVGCSVDEEGIIGGLPYLEIDIDSKSLTKTASSEAVNIRTNRQVKTTVSASWIAAVVEGEQLLLSWVQNESEYPREAVITLSTTNNLITKTLKVVQDASGELTIDGDLILRNRKEIAANTYTKVNGDLIIANAVVLKSDDESSFVRVDFGDRSLRAYPSDITDADIDLLNEQIHKIGEGGLAIVNTQATSLPVEIISANGVETVVFDYNKMTQLPSAETMQSLKIKNLSLAGNNLSDISPLVGCSTIECLDLAGNDICDIDPLLSMTGLKEVILSDLPLTQYQLEVFKENAGFNVVAENIRQEDSPLPVFGPLEMVEVSDTEVSIKTTITNDISGLSKVGFYIGEERNMESMKWYDAAYSEGTLSLTFNPETLQNKVYFVRACAQNDKGANYSKVGILGSLYCFEDIYLRNISDMQNLVENKYSHIEGSVFVGDMSSSNEGIKLDDGKFSLYFAPHKFDDLSTLYQLSYIRDGLYIGNIAMPDTDYISHISGMKTLWLRGNKLSSLPAMEADATLTYLDVSRNLLEDFSFLDRMPLLEKLYLGSSDTPSAETNNIGSLTGLEKYTNLKYIDLSGLPIHDWQAADLRALMHDTEIIFRSGNRDPWIPTVVSRGVSRLEGKVELKGYVNSCGASQITEYGFYFSRDNISFEKIVVGSSIDADKAFTHELAITDEELYYFYPYAVNEYGESRTAVSEFTLAYQDLSQKGTANCYIVSGSGKYVFNPTVKGCTTESVGSIASAELLWETKNTTDAVTVNEVISSVSLSGDKVEFEVPSPMVSGNAVIAVKDAAGTILWSWHIWVTDYDPNATSQVYEGGHVMMDRNLGALNTTRGDILSFGLFYQQGRKDPFIGCGNVATSEFATTAPAGIISYQSGGSVEESIANPNIVYGNNTSEWTGEKNMYDPCPVGWKVPSQTAWSGLSSDYLYAVDYGVVFIAPASVPEAYYPLTGDTEMGRQQLRYPGTSGYMWTTKSGYAFCPAGNCMESRSRYDENPVRCYKQTGFSVSVGEIKALAETATVSAYVTVNDDTVITERGFVYNTDGSTPNMTVKCGSDSGEFTATLSSLLPNAKYSIRAYAVGDGVTKYSATVTFNTLPSGNGDDFSEEEFEWE